MTTYESYNMRSLEIIYVYYITIISFKANKSLQQCATKCAFSIMTKVVMKNKCANVVRSGNGRYNNYMLRSLTSRAKCDTIQNLT